ncbi:MAG: hypothetical protein K2H30_03165 [Clostridia bacterium]|nr:hypothetical protein [Clostridia bacterium]
MEELDENFEEQEKLRYAEFKRKMNLEAACGQVAKLEYNLTDATVEKATLRRACQEAERLKIGAVCVLPNYVKSCVSFLGKDPQVSLIACISFPHGGDTTKMKCALVKQAVKDGVDEAEVTAPIAYIKDGNWGYVKREFKKLKKSAKNRAVRINVESTLLTDQELTKVCSIAADCGITSIRSQSGYFGGTFDGEVIAKMKAAVKDKCTIKADGVSNISDMDIAVDMGAGIIGSKNALDLAQLILHAAN